MATVTTSSARAYIKQALACGQQMRLRYFEQYRDESSYDDDVALRQSGTDLYVSGLHQPIDFEKGGANAMLKEQGRILENASKIYIEGDVPTSGIFRIGMGSPADGTREYAIIPNGVIGWPLEITEPVYKKIYVQILPTGSLEAESYDI